MATVDKNTTGLLEYDVHHFAVDASDLGLKPGQWPITLETTLGNSLLFVAQRKKERDGEMLWVDYYQANGCIWLRVYND